jgi:hypothetical protein
LYITELTDMKPKHTLLLILTTLTILFMAFLIKESLLTEKKLCQNLCCCQGPLHDTVKHFSNGSIDHLIVSIIK